MSYRVCHAGAEHEIAHSRGPAGDLCEDCYVRLRRILGIETPQIRAWQRLPAIDHILERPVERTLRPGPFAHARSAPISIHGVTL